MLLHSLSGLLVSGPDMVSAAFMMLDLWLSAAFPPAICVVFWACCSGALSVGLYRLFNRQSQLTALTDRLEELQAALIEHSGTEVDEARTGSVLAVTRSARRRIRMFPALMGLTTILFVGARVGVQYSQTPMFAVGPHWLRSWLTVFVLAVTGAAWLAHWIFSADSADA